MQRVLSNDLWKAIKAKAATANRRKAAIAYVTQDLVGFREGDVLVVDASPAAISSAATSAKVLCSLFKKGVSLYSLPGLHAKVLLLDDVAVIGSGNMSASSQSTLVEAAFMTDSASIASGVASLIEQLVEKSKQLDETAITQLCKIKVARHGGPGGGHKKPEISELGHRTWLVGVYELVRIKPKEQDLVDEATQTLEAEHHKKEDDLSWIKWTGKSAFALKCKPGDMVIQIWRRKSAQKQPSAVLRSTPVLLRKRKDRTTFVFLDERSGKNAEISWSAFKKLMKRLGSNSRFGPNSARVLDSELAEAISRNWNKAH